VEKNEGDSKMARPRKKEKAGVEESVDGTEDGEKKKKRKKKRDDDASTVRSG
jgi:hypothetical protein